MNDKILTQGKKAFRKWAVRRVRTVGSSYSDCESAAFGLLSSLGQSSHMLRYAVCFILMMVVGVSEVWGQLPDNVTVTTDPANPSYYMLQNVGNPPFSSFYAVPYTNDDETMLSTANVPNSDMRFYLMGAKKQEGEVLVEDEGYYYIIHSSGKYLYAMGDANADGGARLKVSATTPTEDRYKFCIESYGDGYYIKNKYIEANSNKTAPLCKRGGNTGIGPDGSNTKKNFLKMNTYTPRDNFFLWNFIPISDATPITWTAPFTLSTDESKSYYKIKNSVDTGYYISQNNSTVNTSNTVNNDIAWYFMEVPVGENGSDTYITYYYIIHALTGKYMCFGGDPTKYAQNQENPVSIQDKTAANEDNCQFIIVKSSQNGASDLYNIIPKALQSFIWNNQSLDKKNNATIVRTATDRSGDTNRARWIFEPTTFSGAWADPVITCDLEGNITIENGEEGDGAGFYYTINNSTTPPATPTSSDTQYDGSNKPTASTGFNTIKVRAIADGKQNSNVVTKTIVYNPTITFTAGSYTYTGAVQSPISSVDVSTTNIASTEYNVVYKKGGVAADFKDAGDYTIELTDKEGGDYIVYGSTTKSIAQASVTVTADPKSKGYGDADPELTFTTTALQGSDTKATAFTGALSRESGEAKGTYAITQGTLTSANYEITFVEAVFTITNKTLTITAGSDSKVYDGTPLTNSTYSNTALLEGHSLISVTITGSQTVAGSSANIPSGAVIKNGSNEDVTDNYEITYVNGTLTVTQKPVTITADSDTKEYDGTPLTKNTYTNTALLEGHSLTSVTVTGSQTVAGTSDNVPSAAVIMNGETDVTANYAITYTNGTLEVTQKALTITADDATKVYDGTPLTKNTFTNTELASGDNITSVTFSGSQTVVGSSVNVPSAAVIKNGSNENVSASYNITYTNGTLEVTRASVTVTADDASKIYGESDPASFTATVTGMVNNESESLITITSVSRAEGENAGNYAITPAGDATQGNYTVSYVTGTFTITPKALGDGTRTAEGMTITMTDNGSGGYTVTVKDGETTLAEDTHYTLTEEDDVVTITGIGNYSGSARLVYANAAFATPDEAHVPSEDGYAAVYVSAMDVLAPTDVKVYVVKKVNATIGTVTVTEIGYIPEGVPVLLVADNNQTGFAASPITESTTLISDAVRNSNLLRVAPTGGVAVENTEAYMFYKGEFVLTLAGTISQGKIFLYNPNYTATPSPSPSPSPARYLRIVVEDDETGMFNVQCSMFNVQWNDSWYTIDGRKLNGKPTQKGMYINGGKKVIITSQQGNR